MCLEDKLLKQLACPECHSKVEVSTADKGLFCSACSIEFALENGTPIMLTPSRKKELKNDIGEWHDSEIMPKFISYNTIRLLSSPAPFKWFGKKKAFSRVFEEIHEDGLYLDLGGTGSLHQSVLTVNIAPSHDTDIVCDGQFLSFEDNSVDGVFILLVLEHVPNPQAIVKEIFRVLKPGGFLFATLPFLQVMHANPKDYYRFTPDGIRQLFSDFKEIELKVASGPSGTLVWVLKEYIALLCPFSNYSLVYASVRELAGWLLYPLVLFDLYLNTKRRAEKMASFFSYYGKKRVVRNAQI
jgi:SAM-dependent methyltransferase